MPAVLRQNNKHNKQKQIEWKKYPKWLYMVDLNLQKTSEKYLEIYMLYIYQIYLLKMTTRKKCLILSTCNESVKLNKGCECKKKVFLTKSSQG